MTPTEKTAPMLSNHKDTETGRRSAVCEEGTGREGEVDHLPNSVEPSTMLAGDDETRQRIAKREQDQAESKLLLLLPALPASAASLACFATVHGGRVCSVQRLAVQCNALLPLAVF